MAWLRAVESDAETVVGVNKYVIEEGAPEIFRASDESRREVLADLDAVRRERDGAQVEAALRELDRAASGRDNVMPPMVAAVERFATLGEICALLEKRFGKYKPPEVL
jgi:methylmalonyl-CoA mutase N-terminal domain/subunit